MAEKMQEKLDLYIQNPATLTGKTIYHKCIDENDTEPCWYLARVVSTSDEIPELPEQQKFHIHYKIEKPGSVCACPLVEDIKTGELLTMC